MSDTYKLECKHAVYIKNKEDDGIYASIIKHNADGTKERYTKIYKNFQRSFYVTRNDKRDHKQKRAFESIENCIEYKCRQRDLISTVAKALKMPYFKGRPKELFRSPYIYDVDRSITTIFRSRMMKKYGEIYTPNRIAVIDIETNQLTDENYPNIVSVTSEDVAYVGIVESYVNETTGGLDSIKAAIKEHCGKYITERKMTITYFVHKHPGEICKFAIESLHVIKPDVVGVWNMNYDIPIITDYIKRAGHNLANVFSDPSVPVDMRHFEYNEGRKAKTKANAKGEMKDIFLKSEEKWCSIDTPAPFIFCDAMQLYYQLRIALGKDVSYSLDSILNKHLKLSKLKIPGMKNESGLAWHVEAQKYHKPAYVAYNLFDDISVELLDSATKDMSFSLPVFSITSDYSSFSMQTKRTSDNISHVLFDEGLVLCGTSDQMKTVFDEALYSKKDWIVTLDAHGMVTSGTSNIKEMLNYRTNLFINNGDSDMVACYPGAQMMANAAPTTRAMEMVKMQGLDETTQRSLGIDLLSGKTAACEVMFKAHINMLEFDEAVSAFLLDKAV